MIPSEYPLSSLNTVPSNSPNSLTSGSIDIQESSFQRSPQLAGQSSPTSSTTPTPQEDHPSQQQLLIITSTTTTADSLPSPPSGPCPNRSQSSLSTLTNKLLNLFRNCLCFCPLKLYRCTFKSARSKTSQILKTGSKSSQCSCAAFVPYYEDRQTAPISLGRNSLVRCVSPTDRRRKTGSGNSNNNRSKTELDSCFYRRLPAWLILLLVWGVAFLLGIPHIFHTGLFVWKHPHPEVESMVRCRTNLFPTPELRQLTTLYTFITQYAIPIGLTSCFYLHIGIFLWRRETVGALSASRRALMLARKRRRVRLLIFVVLVFAACWAPLNLYKLATDYHYVEFNHSK